MTQNVVLEAAQPQHAPLLANLLELYLHDLSGVFPIEIGPSGRFGYDKLPRYWQEPTRRFPFLIRADQHVAGFVLVTRGSPVTDDPDDFDVAEFFVLRPHRRDHVGRRAAFQLWDRLPGHWIVRVSLGNHRALPFWQSIIRDYTGGAAVEKRSAGTPHDWSVLAFDSPGPLPP
jgi:predicted acetyltransferase